MKYPFKVVKLKSVPSLVVRDCEVVGSKDISKPAAKMSDFVFCRPDYHNLSEAGPRTTG